jgi:four helix bundle protein
MIQSFKDLIVGQKAYELVLRVYRLTEKFPKSEQYGLLSQIRRSSISIVSNIAEGYQRQHGGEYIQFLFISFGSCAELETQLMISKDLGYISREEFEGLDSLLNEVGKMINAMIKKLRRR